MKKLFAILASALTLFALASCNPEDPEKPDDNKQPDKVIPTLTLSAANISVAGIDGESFAVVDMAAKTIKINLEYVDKENARALTVSFLGLPEGVTAQYQKTFDYSNGATQTVAFNYEEEKIAEFVMGVVVAAPDPKFVTLTVGGRNAISGEAHLPLSTDLSSLAVDFTVSPAGTVVTVGGEEVATGDELDFSDKVNGVTFTLTCGEVVNTLNVKVVSSGISSVTRVWGHYVAPTTVEDTWFQTVANDFQMADHWLRTCALDNQYVYLAQHKGGVAAGAYVLNLLDGSLVGRLSTEGISEGTHITSAIRTIPDGDGGFKILECNLIAGEGTLKVYKWDDKDSAPSVVLSYNHTKADRLGDKMGVWGTWKDGVISFLSKEGNPKTLYLFNIKDGVVSATPTAADLGNLNSFGQAYYYSDSEIMVNSVGTKPVVFSVSGDTYTNAVVNDAMGTSDQGFNFFTFNFQKYMAFVRLNLADGDLRIMSLDGETLADSIENLDVDHVKKYGLGDPEEFPVGTGSVPNSLADCAVREIGGETYIVAVVADAGVSLFKLER